MLATPEKDILMPKAKASDALVKEFKGKIEEVAVITVALPTPETEERYDDGN